MEVIKPDTWSVDYSSYGFKVVRVPGLIPHIDAKILQSLS